MSRVHTDEKVRAKTFRCTHIWTFSRINWAELHQCWSQWLYVWGWAVEKQRRGVKVWRSEKQKCHCIWLNSVRIRVKKNHTREQEEKQSLSKDRMGLTHTRNIFTPQRWPRQFGCWLLWKENNSWTADWGIGCSQRVEPSDQGGEAESRSNQSRPETGAEIGKKRQDNME